MQLKPCRRRPADAARGCSEPDTHREARRKGGIRSAQHFEACAAAARRLDERRGSCRRCVGGFRSRVGRRSGHARALQVVAERHVGQDVLVHGHPEWRFRDWRHGEGRPVLRSDPDPGRQRDDSGAGKRSGDRRRRCACYAQRAAREPGSGCSQGGRERPGWQHRRQRDARHVRQPARRGQLRRPQDLQAERDACLHRQAVQLQGQRRLGDLRRDRRCLRRSGHLVVPPRRPLPGRLEGHGAGARPERGAGRLDRHRSGRRPHGSTTAPPTVTPL